MQAVATDSVRGTDESLVSDRKEHRGKVEEFAVVTAFARLGLLGGGLFYVVWLCVGNLLVSWS